MVTHLTTLDQHETDKYYMVHVQSNPCIEFSIVAPSVLATITISPDSASIQIGTEQQLTAVCTDQYGVTDCPTLTWVSSDSSKAIVDSSGLVTGIATGSVSITANNGGTVTSNASLIMIEVPPAEAGIGGIMVIGLAVGALLMSGKSVK
jgi:uncharacterized protein YjdB